jgi:glycolate oxidase
MVENYDKESSQKAIADQALDRLFHWVLANDGAITGEHGVGLAKKRWIGQALGNTGMIAHQQIKNALDPNNLLNPGKFLDP